MLAGISYRLCGFFLMVGFIIVSLALNVQSVGPFTSSDYSTTWLGNSHADPGTRNPDGYIQGRIEGFSAHPDGTLFGSTRWEEGSRNLGIYNSNGEPIGHGAHMHHHGGFGVCASRNHIYALGRQDNDYGVYRLTRDGSTRDDLKVVHSYHGGGGLDDPFYVGRERDHHLRGIDIDEVSEGGVRDRVYVTNHQSNFVRVYDFDMNQTAQYGVTDPWAVAVSGDGNLWIVQPSLNRAAKFNALNGSFMGSQITGLIDPGCIRVDNSDNVWVVDQDGSRQRFLIFSQSGGDAASPMDTFGVAGGVWSATAAAQTGTATVPGEVHPLKFNFVSGVDFDKWGNIYVACDGPPTVTASEGSGAYIRKFNSSRSFIWEKIGVEFLDVSDVDRATDAVHMYTKHEHFIMDWNQPHRQEQRYIGFTFDPFTYPTDWRNWYGWGNYNSEDPADWDARIDAQFNVLVRNMPDDQGVNHRYLYVENMHSAGLLIYRFEAGSEIAIPCATILKDYIYESVYVDPGPPEDPYYSNHRCWYNWRDENGDGLGDGKPNETDPMEYEYAYGRAGAWGWYVDFNGDIWTADYDGFICQYRFEGVNSIGAPIYPTSPSREWIVPDRFYPDYPGTLTDPNDGNSPIHRGWANRIAYVPETDTMYLGGYLNTHPLTKNDEGQWERYVISALGNGIVRYDNWSSANRTERYVLDDMVHHVRIDNDKISASRSTWVKTMDVVGDMLVYAYTHDYDLVGKDQYHAKGRLEAYNHLNKSKLGTLLTDQSDINYKTWIETPRSFTTYLRSNGEYQFYVTDETAAKVLIYRLPKWPLPSVPSAPSGLSATAYRDMQVNLNWVDNSSDEHGFSVEVSSDDGLTFDLIQGCGPDATSCKVRGLVPSTTYHFRVCAVNAGGNSGYSNTVVITTGAVLTVITGTPFGEGMPYGGDPDGPDGYMAAFDGNPSTYVDLIDDWANGGYTGIDAGEAVDVYRIRFVPRSRALFRLSPTPYQPGGRFQGSNDGVSYTDIHIITRDNLMPIGDQWYYVDIDPVVTYRYLRYVSPDGGFCNIAEIVFNSEEDIVLPPDAPENLVATMLSDVSLQLTWTDESTNETGFRIERLTDGFSDTVGPNTESYTDTGLSPSTSYTYRVVAFNTDFESPCINPTESTVSTDSPWPPEPPTGLAASPGDGRVYLSWVHSSDHDTLYYKVYKSTVQGSGHRCVAVAFGGDNIIDSQVANETTYYYYLTAVDHYGLESTSTTNEVWATPHVLDPPDAPSDLQAVAVAYNQIDLSWMDNADNEHGFRLERYDDVSGEFIVVQLIAADEEAASDIGLTAETSYTYRLIAYNPDGESDPSNQSTDTTPVSPPPASPANLAAAAGEGNWIVLVWQDQSDNEEGFRIERRTTGAYEVVADVTENVTTRTDAGLSWETTYTYRVLAYNASGDSDYSNEASDTTPASGGPVLVDDSDPAVTYSGTWSAQSGWPGRINQTIHESDENGAYAELSFTGTAVRLIADMQPWGGSADVEIDGVFNATISFQSVDPNQYQQEVYSITGLSYGPHTIGVTHAGGGWVYIDAFEYESGGSGVLPPPWQSADIGTVGVSGLAVATGTDAFVVSGSGYDIWYDHDAFHYMYQPDTGDVEIIARVDQMTNTHEWAKAGLMIRESLLEGSRFAYVGLTPGHGVQFMYRSVENNSVDAITTESGTAPVWFRLTRAGSTITGYESDNGSTWTQTGTWSFSSFGSSSYIGLAVCSHDDAVLCDGAFSSVSVNTNP